MSSQILVMLEAAVKKNSFHALTNIKIFSTS